MQTEYMTIQEAVVVAAQYINQGYTLQVLEVKGGLDFLLTSQDGTLEVYLETSY